MCGPLAGLLLDTRVVIYTLLQDIYDIVYDSM